MEHGTSQKHAQWISEVDGSRHVCRSGRQGDGPKYYESGTKEEEAEARRPLG